MAIIVDSGFSRADRSSGDRKRHRELVEDSIKKNLINIVAEENIIGQSKDKIVKIPIKGIKEYQFVYGDNQGVGAGTGKEKKGQVIGKVVNGKPQVGKNQAGNMPGEDIYETEVLIEDIINYMFEDLKLPDMERKRLGTMETREHIKRLGYQRKGIYPRLAKRKSLIEKIKRQQNAKRNVDLEREDSQRIPFREEDLRYHRLKEELDKKSNAVIICIMDVSGSMDQSKKYLARSFYFLLYQFVRWKYENVEIAFITHTNQAKEVNEQEFFHHGENGGTIMSSGYIKALEIIEQRYNPEVWNIYVFHCSDGDNWSEDNSRAIQLVHELCAVSNLFGYSEVSPSHQWFTTICKEYADNVKAANFIIANITKKEDVWPALKKIMEKDQEITFEDNLSERGEGS